MKAFLVATLALVIFVIGAVVGVKVDYRKAARQVAPAYTIDYINYRGRTDIDRGFEEYLRANGIKVNITYWDAERSPSKLREIVETVKSRKSDMVVTFGTTVTLSAFGTYNQPNISDRPGVFTLVTTPVATGIVPNWASSLRNITGTVHIAPVEQQIRLMLAYRPVKKIGVLYTKTELNSLAVVEELKELGKRLNVEMITVPFATNSDGTPSSSNAADAIEHMKKQGAGWLYLPPDTFLGTQAKDVVVPIAHVLGIPTFASTEQLMNTGATFGLLSSYYELGVITATQVERILVYGQPPSSIPIARPPRFLRKVNPEAATKLGFGKMIDSLYAVEPVEFQYGPSSSTQR